MVVESNQHREFSEMAGEDLTSSLFEPSPLTPLSRESLTTERLKGLAERIAAFTWVSGLPDWSWGEGVFMLAQTRYCESVQEPMPANLVDWFEHNQHNNFLSGHVNNIAPGAAAARLHSAGALNSSALCEKLLAWVQDSSSSTRASNGAIEHWPGGVWADTCYMVGTFLINYGIVKRDTELVEEAGRQLIAHAELLQNPTTDLFAHGSHRGETLWAYWGRANAWMALAAVEFLEAVEELEYDSKTVEAVRGNLLRQLNALAELLPDYNVWDVLVDSQIENKGIIETSATAGMAAAFFRASELIPTKRDDFLEVAWRALGGCLAYVDEQGVLTRTSAGTVLQLVPFGYSVIRNDRMQLWGQGLVLNAISAALMHGPSEPR